MRVRRPTKVDVLVPAGLWAAAFGCAWAAGFRMRIPWDYYQLLDRQVLAAHPLGGLCYLHSQPPGLNALLAGVLRAAHLLAASPETVATVVFQLLGLAAGIALFHILRTVTESRTLAALGVTATLVDPGYHVFANLFFYEFLVYVLVLLLLETAVRYLHHGDTRALVAAVLLTAAITLTRTLFNPIWSFGLCVLLVLLRGRGEARLWRVALVSAGLFLLLAPWPLKNQAVFGQATWGSMTAYNLARGVPGCVGLAMSTVPPDIEATVAGAREVCGDAALAALTAPTKGDGSPNWNHVVWLRRVDALSRCGVAWRRAHPAEWLAQAAGNYAMWTRATFVHPYGRQPLGPPNPRYLRYASWYRDVLLFDLRPLAERLLPGSFLHHYAMIRGQPVPYTVFGFVVFPVVVALLVAVCLPRPPRVRAALAVLLLYCALWPMLAVCLTDGEEGNRMRFSTSALFIVMLACVWAALHERIVARPSTGTLAVRRDHPLPQTPPGLPGVPPQP